MHPKPEIQSELVEPTRDRGANRALEVNPKAHEPGDATSLKSEEMLGPKAVQFASRDRVADANGVSRKVRLGFRRTLQGTLASLASDMLR